VWYCVVTVDARMIFYWNFKNSANQKEVTKSLASDWLLQFLQEIQGKIKTFCKTMEI
jgi:hypothetical protein